MNLTKNQQILAIAGAVLAVALLGVGGYVLGRGTAPVKEPETTSTAQATTETAVVETPAAEEQAEQQPQTPPQTQTPPEQPKPSFVRYAYVRSVNGSAGNYSASLDFFEILTEDEAKQYALNHGMTAPDNGILYVNEDESAEVFAFGNGVAILYATGGVEDLSMKYATPEQLRSWAAGDWEALPGAMTDMWKVTVDEGEITRIEMIAVAD